uniref:Interleukin-4 n=1 Tax=Amazona collaria TaxID=241587 RepID=A0A8B9GDZ3_9PSIT
MCQALPGLNVLLSLPVAGGWNWVSFKDPSTQTRLWFFFALVQSAVDKAPAAQKGVSKTTRVSFQQDNDLETLCKASTGAWEGRSCHKHLEGIFTNLLKLVQQKAPCPVAGGRTTSLSDFLLDLQRALRRLVKEQSLK